MYFTYCSLKLLVMIKKNFLTCTCMVLLSKALYNIGRTSLLMSSRGVFSKIKCKFSSNVTVAWTVLGVENTFLEGQSYLISYTLTCRTLNFYFSDVEVYISRLRARLKRKNFVFITVLTTVKSLKLFCKQRNIVIMYEDEILFLRSN